MPFGLVFDVDGVLADTEPIIAEATICMFGDLYGVTLLQEDFLPFVGAGALRYVEGPAEKAGVTIDVDRALSVRHERFVRLLDEKESIAFPGVHALIAAAGADPKWSLALATSSFRDKSAPTLRASGIDPTGFAAWITGDDVTQKKPHPEIFLAAAAALTIPPAQCVAIEDSVPGVTSAKAAGMHCIAVTNTFSRDRLGEADRIVDSLTEVDLGALEEFVSRSAI